MWERRREKEGKKKERKEEMGRKRKGKEREGTENRKKKGRKKRVSFNFLRFFSFLGLPYFGIKVGKYVNFHPFFCN